MSDQTQIANITPQHPGNIDPRIRERMAGQLAGNRAFASNVVASYPLLSIRGKEFAFRLPDGRAARHELNGFALPYIDVILVEASPLLSKTYYEKGFDPNEFTRPDCWSQDSVKPDPSSPALHAGWAGRPCGPICATCPQNEFGSQITDAGKKAKACSDFRRVVVLRPNQVGSDLATPMVLRVPQSSLKNLKAHAELLERYGVDIKGCVSRLSFTQAAFPQLLFTFVNALDIAQYDWTLELAKSALVQGMIFTPDFENAVQTPEQETPAHNTGLKPLDPEPVTDAFEKLMGQAVPQQQAQPVQQAQPATQQAKPQTQQAVQQAKVEPDPANIMELATGEWIDLTTGQVVDPPKPKVEAKPLDPDTKPLADGTWLNLRLRARVTGPEVGAPVVAPGTAIPAPAEKAKPVKAKATKAKATAAAEPGSLDALQAASQAAQPAPETVKQTGNGGIVPADSALEDVLKGVLGDGGAK